jgi:FtsP/CotA-like multicopper oxidase with cupredoxin domain
VIEARLSGPVNGYTWPINDKLCDPPRDGVRVNANQRVRVNLVWPHHLERVPMHVDGVEHHRFVDGARARKDTVLVPPKQTVVIDFDTNNAGKWITHCHNTYHLEAGTAIFIEYAG